MSSLLSRSLGALDHQVEQSDAVIPVGSRIHLFAAGKGQGKTSLMLSLLQNPNSPLYHYFDNIILVSPSARYDGKMRPLFEELEQEGKVYEELTESTAIQIRDQLIALNAEFAAKQKGKKGKTKKTPQNLLILDDVTQSLPTGRKASAIVGLFTNSRHLKTSIFLVAHRYGQVPPVIRAQLDTLFVWRVNSKTELESFKRTLNVDEDEFEEKLAYATNEPYSFLYLNMTGAHPTYYKRFDEI